MTAPLLSVWSYITRRPLYKPRTLSAAWMKNPSDQHSDRRGQRESPGQNRVNAESAATVVMRRHALVACFFLVLTCQQATANPTKNLSQEILRATPYPYAAIVRLNIPLQRFHGANAYHVTEDCSGTLVDRNKGMILTAWHCFDGKMDLTQPPKVWLNGAWQELRLGAHGGGMNHDWAIAYLVDPSVADVSAMPFALTDLAPGRSVTMSGYQRSGLKADAIWSKIATTCTVTQHSASWVETDCELNTGASGGAVMSMKGGQAKLVGIISARAATGGVWYVPLSRLSAYFSPL